MSEEGFFRRWARLKAQGGAQAPDLEATAATGLQPDLAALAQTAHHPPIPPAGADPAPSRQLPTLEDVALLGPDSDFSAFVTQGVDKSVQRLAMKKLFSDPHFHIMDGLDVYIDDYAAASPLPAAMLASMKHANSVFAKLLEDEAGKQDPDEAGKQDPDAARKPAPGAEPPPEGDA